MRNLYAGALVLMLISLSGRVSGQADPTGSKRGPYTVVLTVGGGLSYYSTHVGVPPGLEQVSVGRFGIPVTFRAMWHPDHRLRIGLETGLIPMYSYRGTASGERSRVAVSAVPVLLVFSMPLAWLSGTERSLARRLALSGGTGAYRINSHLNYVGTVNANRLSLGWMLAGSYTQPVSRQFRVAAEAKWFAVPVTKDAAFALQLQLVWRAFSW